MTGSHSCRRCGVNSMMTVDCFVTEPGLEAAQFQVIIKFYDAAGPAIVKLLLKLPLSQS